MKKFTMTSDREILPLNIPSNWEEMNTSSIEKYASKNTKFEDYVKGMDLGGFDIHTAVSDQPEHLFVKVFAIKKNEVNDNGDYFSEEELKKASKTFIGVPVFVNHQNDDIEKARGKVVHSWWDEDKGGIYTINMVDKIAYPRLARGIEAGYVTGSSMGASVKYSCCSICHTRAANPKEYCSHIKERKKKNFNGDHQCQYHKSAGSGDEACPLCKCKKGEEKLNKFAGQQIFEYNYDVKFIEDSFVVNPACHDCLVSDVINPTGLFKKVAEIKAKLAKVGSSMDSDSTFGAECSSGQCGLHKAAGKNEINELNYAMNQLERVARSMLAQKNKVSMEYVSDIVKVCSDIQKISDELIEMGYAVLASPTELQIAYGTNVQASPIVKESSPMMQTGMQVPISSMPQPSAVSQAVPQIRDTNINQQPMLKTMPSYANPSIHDFSDDIGRVTKPNFIPVKSNSIKDFIKLSNSIKGRLSKISGFSYNSGENMLDNSDYKFTKGEDTILISSDLDGEVHISHLKGEKLVKWSSIDSFDEPMQELILNNPKQAVSKIISLYKNNNTSEEYNKNMDSNNNNNSNKMAQSHSGYSSEVTTESQLGEVKGIHARTGEGSTGITESNQQLGSGKSNSDVGGTSATPRQNSSYDSTIESTLNSKTNGYMARWGALPEIITEGQWSDISREVFANIPSDWTSVAQEGQLDMLRKTFSWSEPSSTTEGQLSSSTVKQASAGDLIKQAQNAAADAMAFYGIGASDIVNSVNFINSDSSRFNKAKVIVAINSTPWFVKPRVSNNHRLASFAKVASEVFGVEPIDALLSAIGDNAGSSSAADLIGAISFVAKNKLAMQQVEKIAVERFESSTSKAGSDNNLFAKAFSEMSIPEDGLIKVCMSAEADLGMEVSGSKDFVNAVHKFAQSTIDENIGRNIQVVPITIDVDEENGLVEATCKIASKLTAEESKAFEKWSSSSVSLEKTSNIFEDRQSKRSAMMSEVSKLEKQAQLAGGQMPASMNPAGMGMGVQLPGGTPPVGSPGVEALTTGVPPAAGAMDPSMDPLAGGEPEEEDDSKPKPPGAVCIICGNNDVDVQGGKSKCNGPGCGLNYTIKIVPDASMLDKITDGDVDEDDLSESSDSPEKGLGGEGPISAGSAPDAGMGMPPLGAGPAGGGMQVGASTKIGVDVMKKMASRGVFGSISPITGSRNTQKIDQEHWQCLDSGQVYRVRVAAKKGDTKHVYAQWEWSPVFKKASCSSCNRRKNSIINALSHSGISESKFNSMSMKNKAIVLNGLSESNSIDNVKQASLSDIKSNFKKAFTVHGEFPMARCLEKIANRYGENALALSGNCEGKNLAECVCSSLADEGTYTTKLASRVASVWNSPDGSHECVEDFIRDGLTIKKAAQACEDMKSLYVSPVELYAESMSDSASYKTAQEEESPEEVDPFDNQEETDMEETDMEETDMEETDMEETDMEEADMEEADMEETDMEEPEGYNDESDMEESDMEESEGYNDESESQNEDTELAVQIDDNDSSEGDISIEGFDEEMESEGDEDMESEGDEEMESEGDEEMESEGDDMNDSDPNTSDLDLYKESPKSASAEARMASFEKEAMSLRQGRISGVNKINLDINSIRAALNKNAGKLTQISAQDTVKGIANGKPHSSSSQKGFDALNPDVPTNGGKVLSTDHGDSFTEDLPEIPSGSGKFENETNDGELQDSISGGVTGQGSKHTGKYRKLSSIFDRSLEKLAEEMGLEVSPAQNDSDISPISNGKAHSDSTQEGFDADSPDVPENGGKPLSKEKGVGFKVNMPKIPAGKGQMGHESELGRDGEKQNNITGGQDGSGASKKMKSSSANREVAIKLAAKMVENGLIKADQLLVKLSELQRYEVSQLRDLEKAMFSRMGTIKGLKIASSGVEQPLVISEASSHKNASIDLKSKIASLFRLHQQVEMADQSEATKLRSAFK